MFRHTFIENESEDFVEFVSEFDQDPKSISNCIKFDILFALVYIKPRFQA